MPRLPWPWVAFLALTLLSHTWSIQPFYTEVSNTVYIKVALMAVLAAASCEPLVIAWGMTLGGVSIVVLSMYALYMDLPDVQYSAVTGIVFGGVGRNENILAYTLVVSLAATLAMGSRAPGSSGPCGSPPSRSSSTASTAPSSGMGYLSSLILFDHGRAGGPVAAVPHHQPPGTACVRVRGPRRPDVGSALRDRRPRQGPHDDLRSRAVLEGDHRVDLGSRAMAR